MDQTEIIVIKDECQSVSLHFGRLQDARRHGDLAGLLTPDARYVRLGEELTVESFINWIKTTPPNKTRHFVTPTDVKILDGNTAQGLTYYTIYLYGGDEGPPYPLEGPFVVGEYHEQFARTNDGWKIKRREARIIFRKPN